MNLEEWKKANPGKSLNEYYAYARKNGITVERKPRNAPRSTAHNQTNGPVQGGLGLPNGGQLPNGWTYRFSISQALTLDFNPAYENGVPPNISVSFDWNDLTKDEILERAILELN